ncbi:MAG: hypothetical protein JNK35_11790, partial [Phycisphaerae bacterium]|nr:hypothetical protein [Phycisphaerae bacterium]
MRRTLVQRVLGPQATLAHWGWLSVVAALGLTALGLYAIDVASSLTPPESLGAVASRTRVQAIFAGVGILAALVVAL